MQKVLDVVKKTSYGVDFVIFGLENQSKIHYAMPLRHMIGDAFSYLKEYQEVAARNRRDGNFKSSDEFLSNLKKTDRLHAVVSLCVYYGEEAWDGPLCLTDMLEVPAVLRPLVSDYRMNLFQLRTSENFDFHDSDVCTVFEISRFFYEKDYEAIRTRYKEAAIETELSLVIGAITRSQKMIDTALESTEKGGEINMRDVLDEMLEALCEDRCQKMSQEIYDRVSREVRQEVRQEVCQEVRQEELEKSLQAMIRTCRRFHANQAETIENIQKEFSLTPEAAAGYVEKYW